MKGKWLIFFVVLFTGTGLSYAADQTLIKAAKKEGELVHLTGFPRRFIPEIIELFNKMYNLGDDFKCSFTRKGSGAIVQMVEAEHMAKKSKWDTVSMGDASAILSWVDRGLLMKYQPPNVGNIREEFQDPKGFLVGSHVWITSLAIHKKRVAEENWPKSYKDLLDPKWKGRIGLPDPMTSGGGSCFVKFMTDLYGWDFFKNLGRNQPIITKGCGALEQLLLSGEVDVALAPNEFSILERIKAGETDLKVIYPEEGTAFAPMWQAINVNTRHPNAAKLWVEFNATDERQKFVAEKAARVITSKNVTAGFPRPPLKYHKIDWGWMKVHQDDMSKRFREEIQKGRTESK
jgi:iron(III) transport system substrate-binding protein